MLEINFLNYNKGFKKSLKNGAFAQNLFKNFQEWFNKDNDTIYIDKVVWDKNPIYTIDEITGEYYHTGEYAPSWLISCVVEGHYQNDVRVHPDGTSYKIYYFQNRHVIYVINEFKRYIETLNIK